MTAEAATNPLAPATRAEAALLEAALAGDGHAFASLVRPHLSVLYRIAHRACGDSALAEDAVQETLELAHRQLKRYRAGTSLRAFLAAIATKRAHTLIRSERRRKAREEAAPAGSSAPDPEAHALAADTERRIRQALSEMPKKRRAAALLRLDAKLTYEEIAAELGGKTSAAKALVHLAMKDLRAALEVSP